MLESDEDGLVLVSWDDSHIIQALSIRDVEGRVRSKEKD
jgi:hypothetical protein